MHLRPGTLDEAAEAPGLHGRLLASLRGHRDARPAVAGRRATPRPFA